MNKSNVFWSILTAAAAGAAIGMLFAPDDGVKTRKKIKKSANDLATDALDALEKGKTKVQGAADRLARTGASMKDDAVDMANETYDDAKSTSNRMK